MKLATITFNGSTSAARVEEDELVVLPFGDVRELLGSGPDWADRAGSADGERHAVASARFLSPSLKPEKIICMSLNYREHAAEAGLKLPTYPSMFTKFWRTLIGAYDDLVLPPNSDKVDWEIELGIVIGKPVRNATAAEALDAIAGYTIVNDISMRDWQRRTPQYLQGKNFEASTPVGPFMVTPEEVDHARNLRMTLSIDGEVMQDGRTDDQVFQPGDLVQHLSQFTTLMPGDMIATGTPSGVGGARDPEVFLRPGQAIHSAIEGLGEQITHCVATPADD
jgi:acylpyruvate hydrolase